MMINFVCACALAADLSVFGGRDRERRDSSLE